MTEGGVGLADLWMRMISGSEVFEGWFMRRWLLVLRFVVVTRDVAQGCTAGLDSRWAVGALMMGWG